MPFYEYECTACKFYVEVLQKISDEPLRKCPSCKKQTMKRLMSAPAFRLKGEGWYETDFKSEQEDKRNLAADEAPEAKPEEAKAADKEEKPAEKPAEAKPDSKAAAKAPAKKRPAKAAKSARKPAAKAKPAPKRAAKKPAKGK